MLQTEGAVDFLEGNGIIKAPFLLLGRLVPPSSWYGNKWDFSKRI